MRLGIVVCNYNKAEDVKVCLQSIVESKFEDYHVYVVDNGSGDNSVEAIRDNFGEDTRITLLINKENLGGSGGFNTGLRAALASKNEYEYLMCMDNDAYVDEGCIGRLIEFLDENSDTGIAAAKIMHREEPNRIQQYGSFIDWDDYLIDSPYLNVIDDESLPAVVYSDAVPACALIIRRSLVEKIGLMPEENFLYWDDTEWCYRCTKAGYKIASVGDAYACHAMGAKQEAVNTFATYYARRNWIKFFLEHIPDEKLDDFANITLSNLFEIVFVSAYRGELNRATTVMAALDDCLHGNFGKAGQGRIFPVEGTYKPLQKIVQNQIQYTIITGEFPLFSDLLKKQIQDIVPNVKILLTKTQDKSSSQIVGSNQQKTLCVVESILHIDSPENGNYYVDLDGTFLVTEEDKMFLGNYEFARNSYLAAEKNLFLLLAREFREKLI